jgi:type II restriction/modification system DNA methylase subunit YeeA
MIPNKNTANEIGRDKYFFRASSLEFKSIAGSPISYWVSPLFLNSFKENKSIGEFFRGSFGMSAGDPSIIHNWFEVSFKRILRTAEDPAEFKLEMPFAPYDKGGEFRRWYGNQNHVINWKNDGESVRNNKKAAVRNAKYFCMEHISWTLVSSGTFSCRKFGIGFLLDTASNAIYKNQKIDINYLAGVLNSSYVKKIAPIINPTINFSCGVIDNIPVANLDAAEFNKIVEHVNSLESISKSDWDSYETSWDFTKLPLLQPGYRQPTLGTSYQMLRAHWHGMTLDMQRLEHENNRIFIDAYGLKDELSHEVPLNEITLTSNPHYRYGADKTEEELEALLLADTIRELVSYAVGCMFGRYSLDKPGLILANQGESLQDYQAQVQQPSFLADEDNVIPILDGEWFADDVTERFRQFLRVTFGDAHYEENLAFIEQALNIKGKRNYTLRDYILGEFYADHVKRYKKRPIYWLFSSPKGTFNALIYLHRYRPDTASVVLRYLRDFRAKLVARQSTLEQVLINPATSQGEKTRANKEIDTLKKQIIELQDYENDTLYPLATTQVAIDLDDGVKVNYLKLGAALKKIPGLDAKEED